MLLKVDDILKKAEDKGYAPLKRTPMTPLLRPWQHESSLLIETDAPVEVKHENNNTSNLRQTQDKDKTNQRQDIKIPRLPQDEPGAQFKTQPETNLRQTKDKPKTALRQTQDKDTTNLRQDFEAPNQTQDKPETEPKTQLKTNLGQIQDKLKTNYKVITSKTSFFSLVGLQRKIMLLIYENCKLARNKITSPLSIEYIATACQASTPSIQKTIQRLEKKDVLLRAEFKNGRGGWTKYEIPNETFQEILNEETQDKLRTNIGQTQDKPKPQPKTELETESSSSSGTSLININKKNTTNYYEWDQIDISALEKIGFTKNHVHQIADKNLLTPEVVQDSIHAFAFDLEKNKKQIKTNAINFFMGIVKNGQPYTPPGNYISPKEEAMQKYIAQKEKERAKLKELEEKAYEINFEEWLDGLRDKDKLEFLKCGSLSNIPEQLAYKTLQNIFKEEIWPMRKGGIIKNNQSHTFLNDPTMHSQN